MSSLLTALQSIPDHRSARGKRYPLWVLLVFIVMGNLAGYRGNRPLAEFAQRYGRELTRLLLRQPIAGADGKTRFVGLVSVFAHQQGITVDLASLSETENSELSVVQYLIEKLQLELIYKVNLKLSVFFAYQGFQAPETVLSGFPESLVLREFQRLNKSALRGSSPESGCLTRPKKR
jgi:hypothetical protein